MLVFGGEGEFERGERHVQWRLSGKVCDFSVVRRGKEKGRDEMHNRVIVPFARGSQVSI